MQGAWLWPWFETPRLRAALTMRFRISVPQRASETPCREALVQPRGGAARRCMLSNMASRGDTRLCGRLLIQINLGPCAVMTLHNRRHLDYRRDVDGVPGIQRKLLWLRDRRDHTRPRSNLHQPLRDRAKSDVFERSGVFYRNVVGARLLLGSHPRDSHDPRSRLAVVRRRKVPCSRSARLFGLLRESSLASDTWRVLTVPLRCRPTARTINGNPTALGRSQ